MVKLLTVKNIETMNFDIFLINLERFGISTLNHSHDSLLSHLKGTANILNKWNCSSVVCLAGLCHSIYGTESFVKQSATLENRDFMKDLIGVEAENLAYLFGAHKKESLWANLELSSHFNIYDRFAHSVKNISKSELSSLVTITLANWLEQRPRSSIEHQFVRKDEFLKSKNLLPEKAYDDFLLAYELSK